jgi:hypothetical protein
VEIRCRSRKTLIPRTTRRRCRTLEVRPGRVRLRGMRCAGR